MSKVLILGVSAVQADAIILLKKMGHETYACAMAKDGPGAYLADHFEQINILDKVALMEYMKSHNISLVYSVGSDLAMPIASSISEELNLPYFVTERTARICNNKNLMRTTLGKNFKGNLNFQILQSANEKLELEYPFIIKPADSQGQRGVRLVRDHNDFLENYNVAKNYSRSGLVVLEQYISGDELSVNGYMVEGELRYLEISYRATWPEHIGLIHKHIVPAERVEDDTNQMIKDIIISACGKLDIKNGPVYVQMKVEQDTPYIIEITPRLDGCHMWNVLTYSSGVNLLKLTFDHLLDHDISELNNLDNDYENKYTLEFLCQEPNKPADYSVFFDKNSNLIFSYNYYEQGEKIRSINGKFEKIGYIIYKDKRI